MSLTKYPDISVQLVGEDGNAFVILARVDTALRRANVEKSVRDQFFTEATSGDYDHLLATVCNWVNVD